MRAVVAWVLYDWAYGAFTTVVSTFVFATYFTQAVAHDPASGTALWAGGQSAAGLVIALLAVPLGAIADRGGRRRAMLGAATAIMALATAGLWFVRPHAGDATLAISLVVLATIAFEVATVFYNAMLPGLVSHARLGRLSMLGWGTGYLGGLVALGLCLGVLVMPATPPWGLDRATAQPVRACALLAAAWLVAFAWPVVAFGPIQAKAAPWRDAVRLGLADLRRVLPVLRGNRRLVRFVVARLFYMDGLVTLFAFGGIYAAGQFGLTPPGVLMFGIGLSLTGAVGVGLFALVEDRIGSLTTVLVSVLALALLGAALLLIHSVTLFWLLGLLLGVFVGPAQAASRSLMARMAPVADCAAYFGVLALSGRVTAFAGPLALSAVTAATGSQRAGMAVIVAFLLAGAALLATMGQGSAAVPAAPPQRATPPAAPASRTG